MPTKEAEAVSWDIVLVDIIVPYKFRREGHDDPLIIKYITIIDPKNGWCEIVRYNDKNKATIENLVDQVQLCR